MLIETNLSYVGMFISSFSIFAQSLKWFWDKFSICKFWNVLMPFESNLISLLAISNSSNCVKVFVNCDNWLWKD